MAPFKLSKKYSQSKLHPGNQQSMLFTHVFGKKQERTKQCCTERCNLRKGHSSIHTMGHHGSF